MPADLLAECNHEGHPLYIRSDENKYSRLHDATLAVSDKFGIRPPASYIDTQNQTYGEVSIPDESVIVAEDVYEALNSDELEALVAHEIKHIYQGLRLTPIGMRWAEYDADRASVAATDSHTTISFHRKLDQVRVARIPDANIREKLQKESVNVPDGRLYSSFPNEIARALTHPSHHAREAAINKYGETLAAR